MRTFFSSKQSLFAFMYVSLTISLLTSCQKETIQETDLINEIETGLNIKSFDAFDGENVAYTTNLMAGQHHIAGKLTVSSDETNLYATYHVNCSEDTGSWTLKATHLYVGDCNAIPQTKSGNPKIGKFPYKTEHPNGISDFTYTIPLSSVEDCFCLAAHAEVDCGECEESVNDDEEYDSETGYGEQDEEEEDDDVEGSYGEEDTEEEIVYNNYCGEETSWAEGNEFPGNSWAMYIEFCIDNDNIDEEEEDEEDVDDEIYGG